MLYNIILIKKCKWDLVILRHCQLYIKAPFKLQPEDGFMKAETCSSHVLLINYILCNKVVLRLYIYIYILLIIENTMGIPHLKIILTVLFSTELVGGFMHALYELSWWQTELPNISLSSSINSTQHRHLRNTQNRWI
jgi:hypothetical protein